MTYSTVDIANMALGHIGKSSVLNLSETSAEAREVNFWFSKVVNVAKLRSPWTFDRTLFTLASLDNDYEERWSYKFDLPSSLVKIVRVIPRVDPHGTSNMKPVPYQRMGGALYTNEREAKVDGVNANVNPSNWPDDFALAVSFLLAARIAPRLTRKPSYVQQMTQSYEYHLGLAIESDAGQEPTYYAYESEYLHDRGADGANHDTDGAGVDDSIYWR